MSHRLGAVCRDHVRRGVTQPGRGKRDGLARLTDDQVGRLREAVRAPEVAG